ncbi:MAG TPA: terminase family protein, partial [Tepidisphaeraceae bacterium]
MLLTKIACSHPAGLARHLTKDEPIESLRYLVPDHVRFMSRRIEAAIRSNGGPGEPKKRVMVFAPPRHGKSELTSHRTPVWFLNNWPDRRVMFGTYSADFAKDWGRKVRNTVEQHQDQLGVTLSDDSTSTNSWHTSAGGGMMAQGIGGAFTGRGGDLLICDDPYKNLQDANSASYRDTVWGWWTSAFVTRVEPNATIILTLTRWHVDDVAGRILADPAQFNEWDVIMLPALAEAGDPMGRVPGEALWPARKSREALLKEQVAVGDYVWSSLYRQRPPNLSGGNVYYGFTFGDWNKNEGNIDETVPLVSDVPLDFSIDFNKQPGSHGIIGQYLRGGDQVTAIDELMTPLGVAKHLTLAFVDWWKQHKPKVPYVNLFGDPAGGAGVMTDGKNAWDTVAAELRQAGIPFKMRVPPRHPGVHNRVGAVNNALVNARGERRYRISPKCKRLIRDMQQVKWDGDDIKKSNTELS